MQIKSPKSKSKTDHETRNYVNLYLCVGQQGGKCVAIISTQGSFSVFDAFALESYCQNSAALT